MLLWRCCILYWHGETGSFGSKKMPLLVGNFRHGGFCCTLLYGDEESFFDGTGRLRKASSFIFIEQRQKSGTPFHTTPRSRPERHRTARETSYSSCATSGAPDIRTRRISIMCTWTELVDVKSLNICFPHSRAIADTFNSSFRYLLRPRA